MDLDFEKINKVLKKFFPKTKIVFGGSAVGGNAGEYSDIDVYIIFRFFLSFYRSARRKEIIKSAKEILRNERINLHFVPNIFLLVGYYRIKGFYFFKEEKKEFLSSGSPRLLRLNSVKLCLKNLAGLKVSKDINGREKFKHDFLKNLKFLGKADISELQFLNSLKDEETFYLRDWFLFCLWHRRCLPLNFERIVIDAFYHLIEYASTQADEHKNSLIELLDRLEREKIRDFYQEDCFKRLDKYVFLIFLV